MIEQRAILLVEDNPDDEALALVAFGKLGMARCVSVARDGQEALDHLARTEELPSLVLLDLKLPRLDGLEVLRRMRAQARMRSVPVVVLTTSCEPSDIEQAILLGANSYVRKRIDFGDFQDAISRIAFYWMNLNERAAA
jgi:two-component system response regulator